MNDKELDELLEYNQEYMEARLSDDVFGGDYTSEVELKHLKKDYDKLQSNWNSLRKCIIGIIEGAREELNTIIHTTDIGTKDGLKYVNQCSREFDVIRKNLEIALNKMNELEGKDKE